MKKKKDSLKLKSIIDAPICVLENIFEYGIDARKLRRLWFICLLSSAGVIITLILLYARESFDRAYLVAFISLTAGIVSAFLIAWINEVSKIKECQHRRMKFRKYYVAKYKLAKTAKQRDDIHRQIEERNLFEDQPIFTEEELLRLDTLVEVEDDEE